MVLLNWLLYYQFGEAAKTYIINVKGVTQGKEDYVNTGAFSEMGFIMFHRHHSLYFGWVLIFESKWKGYTRVCNKQQFKPQAPTPHCGCSSWWRCYGVRAALFQWLVVIQAGLSCDCLSVPAVQVSGCSAQQV